MGDIVEDDSESFASSDSSQTRRKKKQNVQKKRDALDPEKAILKYKTLAKYKALKQGEMQMYTDIENNLVELALCKGLACDDTSVEESERAIEEQLNKVKKIRPEDDDYDGRRSENSELLDSVRSSMDFWKDMRKKDDPLEPGSKADRIQKII